MTKNYTDDITYKKLKIIFIIFFTLALLFVTFSQFLAYKIKQEAQKLAHIKQQSFMQRDLHTLCMLDYMINPNGKDILEDCKKIEVKQTKIDTPYLDFYLKYIY